jgi:hypothetical protein
MAKLTFIAWILAASGQVIASDNLVIMNPDAGIYPYGATTLTLLLTREVSAPGERQSVRVDAPKGGYADVYRTMAAAMYGWGDWRDYGRVRFWVRNANERDVEMHFNIKSSVAGKVVNGMKYFKLKPGDQTVTLNLDDCLAAGKVRPNLKEVSSWLFAFDEGFEKPLHVGAVTLLRSCKQLLTDRRPEAIAVDWQVTAGAIVERIEGDLLLKVTSSTGQNANAWWTIPRDKKTFFQVPETRNIWRGYERLAIDFDNPASAPLACAVVIGDQTAGFDQKPGSPAYQMARIPIQVPCGRSTSVIPLTGLAVSDGARLLDLDDVRALGMEISADAPASLMFDNLRLLTTRDDAGGAPPPPARIRCQVCGWGLSDQYAQQCPRCGGLFEATVTEPAPEDSALRLAPAADAYVWMVHDNATYPMRPAKDTSKKTEEILAMGHYENSPYENRVFMRFELDGIALPAGAGVARAELRLFPSFESGKARRPYLPPLDVFAVEGTHGHWRADQLTWSTQPGADRWIFNGGLYQWRLTPGMIVIDLTGYVREKWSGDKSISLIIKATTAGPCSHDNHMMGHMLNVYSSRAPDPALRPYLYLVPDEKR